jgi:hypothetical protein
MLLSETLLCHDTDLVYITNINQDVTLRDITVSHNNVSESNILVDVCDVDQISIMTQ